MPEDKPNNIPPMTSVGQCSPSEILEINIIIFIVSNTKINNIFVKFFIFILLII